MWNRLRRGLLIKCVAAAALLPIALVCAADTPEEIEARLEQLKAEIGIIQQRLDRDLGERDRRLEELADAERRVSAARRAVSETAASLESTRIEIDRLQTRRRELETRVTEHAHSLAAQLAVAYRHGTGSRLKMLLNQDDPRRLSRQLAYHGYLTRARLDAMDRLNQSLGELARTGEELDQQQLAQEQLLRREQEELEGLEVARADRERALATLEERIQDDRERISELEEDAAELTRLLEELAVALADVPPDFEVASFAELRGELPIPVNGRVARSFGEQRGGDLQWSGWLIRAEAGESVRAVAHGRVAYADWLRGYGLLMIIDHGDGFMSLYAHNEALLRDVGDWVSPGEAISTVGNTGGVDETGVYFELRREGRPMDPVGWVAR
jgi:murein hydrolase activator